MSAMMGDNTLLVEFQSERDYRTDTVDVEVTMGNGDDVTFASFDVDDQEPPDVWGPIFSRIFDHLGITLSDPGDFSWESVPLDSDAYLVTINCDFTEA